MTRPVTPLQRDIYYRGYRLSISATGVSIWKDAEKICMTQNLDGAKLVVDSWMEAK